MLDETTAKDNDDLYSATLKFTLCFEYDGVLEDIRKETPLLYQYSTKNIVPMAESKEYDEIISRLDTAQRSALKEKQLEDLKSAQKTFPNLFQLKYSSTHSRRDQLRNRKLVKVLLSDHIHHPIRDFLEYAGESSDYGNKVLFKKKEFRIYENVLMLQYTFSIEETPRDKIIPALWQLSRKLHAQNIGFMRYEAVLDLAELFNIDTSEIDNSDDIRYNRGKSDGPLEIDTFVQDVNEKLKGRLRMIHQNEDGFNIIDPELNLMKLCISNLNYYYDCPFFVYAEINNSFREEHFGKNEEFEIEVKKRNNVTSKEKFSVVNMLYGIAGSLAVSENNRIECSDIDILGKEDSNVIAINNSFNLCIANIPRNVGKHYRKIYTDVLYDFISLERYYNNLEERYDSTGRPKSEDYDYSTTDKDEIFDWIEDANQLEYRIELNPDSNDNKELIFSEFLKDNDIYLDLKRFRNNLEMIQMRFKEHNEEDEKRRDNESSRLLNTISILAIVSAFCDGLQILMQNVDNWNTSGHPYGWIIKFMALFTAVMAVLSVGFLLSIHYNSYYRKKQKKHRISMHYAYLIPISLVIALLLTKLIDIISKT